MKFLIDQNRSPRLAKLLIEAGHDAVHTLGLGLEQAEDIDLLLVAVNEDRVIVSGDTDFGTLLALSNRSGPSVILFRSRTAFTAEQQAELLLAHLDELAHDLNRGAMIVVTDQRIRVRRLPLLREN